MFYDSHPWIFWSLSRTNIPFLVWKRGSPTFSDLGHFLNIKLKTHVAFSIFPILDTNLWCRLGGWCFLSKSRRSIKFEVCLKNWLHNNMPIAEICIHAGYSVVGLSCCTAVEGQFLIAIFPFLSYDLKL